jgi:pterin-4a-carbinolamine dehydratase
VLLFTNNLLNKKMKHSRKSTRLKSMRGVPTSSRLHLSHPKHTGKLIHHSSTSYPVLAMLLLVVGVLLGGMTHRTQAGSLYGSGTGQYVISASVPGPAPKVAAIINTPVDGVHSSVSPITVAGSCPVDTYISLYRNGLFSGVSLCTIDGKWNIETSLFAGRNDLVAKVFNLTDVPGPVVGGITVFYDLPTVPINSPGSPSSGASTLSQSNQTPLPVPTIHPSSKSPLPAIDTTANANTLTLKSTSLKLQRLMRLTMKRSCKYLLSLTNGLAHLRLMQAEASMHQAHHPELCVTYYPVTVLLFLWLHRFGLARFAN